jgi:hypothetical protein
LEYYASKREREREREGERERMRKGEELSKATYEIQRKEEGNVIFSITIQFFDFYVFFLLHAFSFLALA